MTAPAPCPHTRATEAVSELYADAHGRACSTQFARRVVDRVIAEVREVTHRPARDHKRRDEILEELAALEEVFGGGAQG